MIKLLRLSTFIFLLSFTTTQSQEVQFGLRLETNVLKISTPEGYYITGAAPSALQINLAMFPASYLAIDTRLGVEGSKEYYQGVEYGIFARYYPIKYVYGIAGVLIHNTIDDSHNTWRQYAQTLVLPGIGIGLSPGHLNVEAMYLFTGNKEVGYEWSFISPPLKIPNKLYWVWKVGVGFNLSLFSF